MKRSRYADSQIMAASQRVEAGLVVSDLCRELGVSVATFSKWRFKCGGMDALMMANFKELVEENRRLKRMYAEGRMNAEIVA